MNKADRERIARAVEMLRVAGHHSEEHAAEEITHYDGADCDGSCVNEDCNNAADDLLNFTGYANA